jgi:hypothetical protein
MRRLSLIALVSLLALPASALASTVAVGDGSLAVASANAKSIVVAGHGLIYGYIDQGAVTVISYTPDDSNQFQISGAAPPKPVGTGARYAGSGMRFLISGAYVLKFEGSGINLSAVGKGSVTATSADSSTDSTTSSSITKPPVVGVPSAVASSPDGTVAVNGGKPQSIGHNQIVALFGSSKLGQ